MIEKIYNVMFSFYMSILRDLEKKKPYELVFLLFLFLSAMIFSISFAWSLLSLYLITSEFDLFFYLILIIFPILFLYLIINTYVILKIILNKKM